jgi:hypothetical protein
MQVLINSRVSPAKAKPYKKTAFAAILWDRKPSKIPYQVATRRGEIQGLSGPEAKKAPAAGKWEGETQARFRRLNRKRGLQIETKR